MKKNKKLELKKETITILDKMQAESVVGGYENVMSRDMFCLDSDCHTCRYNACPAPKETQCCTIHP